jgi:hydrogenase maturation protease
MKVVIGVGNVFMKDDGCGSFIVQALDGLIPIDVKDLGMGSLSIIDDIRDYDEIIIIDAADIDSDVEVFEIKTELEDEIPQAVISMSLGGSHSMSMRDILTILNSDGKNRKIIVIGCKPKEINVGYGLSEEMIKNGLKVIEKLKEFIDFDVDEAKKRFLSIIREITSQY